MTQNDPKLQLYLTHRAALIDYATPIVGDRMRAEDLVQEAYLRFLPADGTDRAVDQPVSYLYRIVRNLALDWTRQASAERRRNRAHRATFDGVPSAPSPEEEALQRAALRGVETALAELPDGVRAAFEMHRLGGLTFRQIGERLDVSTATAGRWVQQALLHVTKSLRDSDA